MKKFTIWLCALSAAVPVGLVTSPAQADCLEPSISRSAGQADAVFVGSVTEMVGHNLFEVRASDVYQGSPGAFLTVKTGPRNANVIIEDTVSLQVDKQYLFFLVRRRGDWRAPGCFGTREISSKLIAQADRALGPATPLRAAPAAPSASSPSGSPSNSVPPSPSATSYIASDQSDGVPIWAWLVGGGVLLVAVGVAAAWLLRRPSSGG